jgi:hypothetical protein
MTTVRCVCIVAVLATTMLCASVVTTAATSRTNAEDTRANEDDAAPHRITAVGAACDGEEIRTVLLLSDNADPLAVAADRNMRYIGIVGDGIGNYHEFARCVGSDSRRRGGGDADEAANRRIDATVLDVIDLEKRLRPARSALAAVRAEEGDEKKKTPMSSFYCAIV